MTWVILHQDRFATLATDDALVPADAVPAFADAMALLAGLETVRADAIARGHADGKVEGRAAAAAEHAATLLDLKRQTAAARAELRSEAVTMALAIVRRIADGIGAAETVAALAARAAETLVPDTEAEVRVPPLAVAAAVARLGQFPGLIVVGDPALGSDECVLATPLGSIRAGLDVQLSTIERTLADAG